MCDDLGAKSHLIMVDGENIASVDAAINRQHAVESHYPWVDAAKFLGCTSIRVNLGDAMSAMTGKGEASEARCCKSRSRWLRKVARVREQSRHQRDR